VPTVRESGVSKMNRSGEFAAEPTPSETAEMRSNAATAFYASVIACQPRTRRWIAQASGSAVIPTKMSP